jgi:hypothetical protein
MKKAQHKRNSFQTLIKFMNTTPNRIAEREDVMSNDSNQDFVSKLKDIVVPLHQKLNIGLIEPRTVVGLGICTVQMDGLSTCFFVDCADKPENPGMRMASAILATCSQAESNLRVSTLLNKARKLTEEALRIRIGEIITTTLH